MQLFRQLQSRFFSIEKLHLHWFNAILRNIYTSTLCRLENSKSLLFSVSSKIQINPESLLNYEFSKNTDYTAFYAPAEPSSSRLLMIIFSPCNKLLWSTSYPFQCVAKAKKLQRCVRWNVFFCITYIAAYICRLLHCTESSFFNSFFSFLFFFCRKNSTLSSCVVGVCRHAVMLTQLWYNFNCDWKWNESISRKFGYIWSNKIRIRTCIKFK